MNGSVELQKEVTTLPELFHLIESIFESGKDLSNFIPKDITSLDYINSIDELVNRDKLYSEDEALKAFYFFQYIDLDKIENEDYVEELRTFLDEKSSFYANDLSLQDFCSVANLTSAVNKMMYDKKNK